jgi:hypothetical protein
MSGHAMTRDDWELRAYGATHELLTGGKVDMSTTDNASLSTATTTHMV